MEEGIKLLTGFMGSGGPWEIYWGFWALLRANSTSVGMTIKLDKSECLWGVCVCVFSSTFSLLQVQACME